jgi:asparagine synthase (glutamine-hydrolysing)
MCRIFGHFGGALSPHELRVASLLQRHGGPDAQSIVRGENWALGNDRLAIVDIDGGRQPFSHAGSVQVVFNGEIYNHAELRRELQGDGYAFPDRCDGSIIPALYVKYGPDFVRRLEGMYAIAIVDLREEPILTLYSDHAGMKSLYYHWDRSRGHIYFASEIPALLSLAGVDRRSWDYGLEAYLATKTPFGERTLLDEVRVLPPAATLTVKGSSGLELRIRDQETTEDHGSLAETAERLRRILQQETARLVCADVRVCAITSGGLDSSLITALASQTGSELHTFNIAYRGSWPSDERAFAVEVAARYRTIHHQIEVDPADFPALLGDVVWHLGQPNADPITLSSYVLFQAVHEAGFKVALTGDAADELFGGYERMRRALSAGTSWAAEYVESLAAIPRALRSKLYGREYQRYVESQGWADDAIREALLGGSPDRMHAISQLEIRQRLPAYHLRRVDHLSMAHAVEARIPFCQPSVMQLAAAIPEAKKIAGGAGKRVLYAAAEPLLPASVLNRPKQPFTLPIAAMMQPGAALTEFARDMLSPSRIARRGILDASAVGRLFESQAAEANPIAAQAIWSLLVFELWHEQFAAGRVLVGEEAAA